MKAYFLLTIGKQTLREEKEMSITAMCLFVRQSNNVACVKVSNSVMSHYYFFKYHTSS